MRDSAYNSASLCRTGQQNLDNMGAEKAEKTPWSKISKTLDRKIELSIIKHAQYDKDLAERQIDDK